MEVLEGNVLLWFESASFDTLLFW